MATVKIPEVCLICYEKLSSRELNRRKFASSEQIEEAFSTDVVFTLKTLLNIPEELFESFVGKLPGTWISLCDGCIEGVVEAKTIYQEILELSRKFKIVQDKVVDKLKRSWEENDKVKGRSPRKKARMKEDSSLSVTDECRKCVNERVISPTTDEEPFLIEDVATFTRRLCGRLSAPDNFGIATQTFIILPPASQPVNLEPLIFHENQDNYSMEYGDIHDPLSISEPEDDKDPLSILNTGFDDAGPSHEWEDATNESDADIKNDLEIKPEAEISPPNSDPDWQHDEISLTSSESPNSPDKNDKRNKCPTCPKEFGTVVGLKAHLWQIHHLKVVQPAKDYPCSEPNCTLTFSDHRECRRHVLSHKRGDPKHKCETCGKAFFDTNALRHHTKKVHDITLPPKRIRPATLQCPECPKIVPNSVSMRHHMLTSHQTEYIPEPSKSFPCTHPNCGKILSSKRNLSEHLSRHEGKPRHKCDHCDQIFYTNLERSEHRKLKHPGLPFSCALCQNIFTSQHALSKHLQVHSNDKPERDKPQKKKLPASKSQCELCGKQLASQAKLQVHLKFQHEKDFKIRCSICNQGMRYKASLKIHMVQTHKISMDASGQLPQCPVVGCRRVFPGKQGLDQHMAKEHGESGTMSRFQCSHCGKGFHEKHKFSQHEMIHLNGETKPFKCEICEKGFANQGYLRYHQLNTHKAERKRERRK